MRIVVIGASWGGLRAVGDLLAGLPVGFPAPVLVAQHRSSDADEGALEALLARRTALPVTEAADKAPLVPGEVLIAPAGLHLLLEAEGCVGLSLDAPVQFSRPSLDVLFESAVAGYGSDVVGVVLTGANADGAHGLAAVQRVGGVAFIQDPAEAERAEMPAAALAAVPDARVLPLAALSAALVEELAR